MKNIWPKVFVATILVSLSFSIVGCISPGNMERHELDVMASNIIERVSMDWPNVQEKIDKSEGYLVFDKRVVKVPFVGAGAGLGVAVDGRSGEKTYLRIRRMEIGGGFGARKYKALLIIQDRKLLERIMGGTWMYEVGTEMSAGKSSVEGTGSDISSDKKYSVIVLPEKGASVTWTLRAIRLVPYE